MTVDITTNKKALDVKTNDLFTLGFVDFRENLLFIHSLRNIVLEAEANGFNINHIDGYKNTLNVNMFTRIGTKYVGVDIFTNEDLVNEFKLLTDL